MALALLTHAVGQKNVAAGHRRELHDITLTQRIEINRHPDELIV